MKTVNAANGTIERSQRNEQMLNGKILSNHSATVCFFFSVCGIL